MFEYFKHARLLPMAQNQPFTVPSTIVPDIPTAPIRVPDVITGESIKSIPEWEYKKFSVFDIFHSKLGISIIASILTFAILAYVNPPFVQESGDNKIEIRKPNMSAIYTVSLIVFCILFFVPIVPSGAGKK